MINKGFLDFKNVHTKKEKGVKSSILTDFLKQKQSIHINSTQELCKTPKCLHIPSLLSPFIPKTQTQKGQV